MGHACAHIWPYMGAHMGHMGAAMGHAYAHTWPYMGAYMGHMGAYMAHIWEQPYRESREEGNSRESLPFPGPGKGIASGLSLPCSAAYVEPDKLEK